MKQLVIDRQYHDGNEVGDKQTDGFLDLRSDLDPASYAGYVRHWLQAGATVVGGCCGTRPEHITRIPTILGGYFMRDVPARSAPVYEHQLHKKPIILGSKLMTVSLQFGHKSDRR